MSAGEHPVEPIDSGIVDWVWDRNKVQDRFGYTDSDLVVLARVLLRPCTECEASPGDWCRTKGGQRLEGLDRQHLARRSIGHPRIW